MYLFTSNSQFLNPSSHLDVLRRITLEGLKSWLELPQKWTLLVLLKYRNRKEREKNKRKYKKVQNAISAWLECGRCQTLSSLRNDEVEGIMMGKQRSRRSQKFKSWLQETSLKEIVFCNCAGISVKRESIKLNSTKIIR